ncbi:MAG: CHAD domain-containing protein [Tepidisphaerales bacterium]
MHKSNIGQYLDGLLEELRLKATPAFATWDADAIHDARVCTRRLGAAMKLLSPLLAGAEHDRFSRLMKRLRRRLGPLRDLDVMLEHARQMKAASFPLAMPWTIQQLEDQRTALRAKVSGRTKPLRDLAPWVGWWNKVPDLDRKAEELLLDHIPVLLASFDIQARELLDAHGGDRLPSGPLHAESGGFRETALPREAQDPHALRIVGKELRYSLELARAGGLDLPGRVFKTFKQLQDSLGLWHDHVVLSQTILKLSVDFELACHDVVLFGEILKLAQWVWHSADRHLLAFLRRWHEKGPALCEQLSRSLSPVRDAPKIDSVGKVEPTPSSAGENSKNAGEGSGSTRPWFGGKVEPTPSSAGENGKNAGECTGSTVPAETHKP